MKRKFGFSIVLLIMTLFMVRSKFSLIEFTTSDLILFIIALTGSLFVVHATIDDLKELESKTVISKIILIFNLFSSLAFLLSGLIFLILRLVK